MVDGHDGAFWCLVVLRLTGDTYVHRHLEVVLLLTDEGIVRHGEVEPFVCVDAITRGRTKPNQTQYEDFRCACALRVRQQVGEMKGEKMFFKDILDKSQVVKQQVLLSNYYCQCCNLVDITLLKC